MGLKINFKNGRLVFCGCFHFLDDGYLTNNHLSNFNTLKSVFVLGARFVQDQDSLSDILKSTVTQHGKDDFIDIMIPVVVNRASLFF